MSVRTLRLHSMRALVGIVGTLAWGLVLASGASAHQEPPGCQGSGVNLQLFVYFSSGPPADATAATFSECETVVYQARLCQAGIGIGGVPVCALESGAIEITTPDGTVTDVTPAGGIPLLSFVGGQPECIDSETVTYTVSPADVVGGEVVAVANYIDGVSHTGPMNGTASAETDINNDVAPCPDPIPCVNRFCDPTATDGPRMGLCVEEILDSTPCPDTDGNECTTAGCDAAGICDQDHVLDPDSTPCTDSDGNECTTAGCDAAGNCVQDHILVQDSTPCTDNDMDDCTMAGCDAAGMCDQLHVTVPDCPPFCASNLRFDQSGTLDTLFLRLGYTNLQNAPYDPTTDGLKITLSNANGVVWSGALLPGDIIKRGRAWRYRDRTGVRNGIRALTTSPRKRDGVWRLSLSVTGDFSAATLAEMTVTVEAAGMTVPKTSLWTQVPDGWQTFFRRF
jgi:hypothetical protein